MHKSVFVFVLFLGMAIFSCLLPYPVFSPYTNIDTQQAYKINNLKETELSPPQTSGDRLLSLDFKDIDFLLPIGEKMEIIDLKTKTSFVVQRTGGNYHFDVEPIDVENSEIIFELSDKDWSWKRHPVLVKLNDIAYLPASIVFYPHGRNTIDNSFNGHMCLHFKGSKMDGTKRVDETHRKVVNLAKKIGKQYLNSK